MDVLLERRRVAVVRVEAGGPRLELVGELARPGATISKTPSMFAGWMPWKWIVCGCEPRVHEAHAQDVALGRAQDRAGDGAVVRPGREEDARRDLDLPVDRGQRVLAHAARLGGQRRRRVEQRVEVVRAADGGRASPIIAAWPIAACSADADASMAVRRGRARLRLGAVAERELAARSAPPRSARPRRAVRDV